MEDKEKRWYVIHTYSGYEPRVKANLEQRVKSMGVQDEISSIVIPTEEEIEVRNGQRHTVEKKLFPGYVLVRMKLTEKSWNVVRNTPGVTGFVGAQDEKGKLTPAPLEDSEVEVILKRIETKTPRVKVGFSKGQSVRIIDGPFLDFLGVVDEVNPEKGKVKVLVSFFGRETPVELDLLQVERL
jgi:transcriptional antiterminator NusG